MRGGLNSESDLWVPELLLLPLQQALANTACFTDCKRSQQHHSRPDKFRQRHGDENGFFTSKCMAPCAAFDSPPVGLPDWSARFTGYPAAMRTPGSQTGLLPSLLHRYAGEPVDHVTHLPFRTIRQKLQERQHDRLKVWNRHGCLSLRVTRSVALNPSFGCEYGPRWRILTSHMIHRQTRHLGYCRSADGSWRVRIHTLSPVSLRTASNL